MKVKKLLEIVQKFAQVRDPSSSAFDIPKSELPQDYVFEVLDPQNPGKYMKMNTRGERVGDDDYSAAITNRESAISVKMHQTHKELEDEQTKIENRPIEDGPYHQMVSSAEQIQEVTKTRVRAILAPKIAEDRRMRPDAYSSDFGNVPQF